MDRLREYGDPYGLEIKFKTTWMGDGRWQGGSAKLATWCWPYSSGNCYLWGNG